MVITWYNLEAVGIVSGIMTSIKFYNTWVNCKSVFKENHSFLSRWCDKLWQKPTPRRKLIWLPLPVHHGRKVTVTEPKRTGCVTAKTKRREQWTNACMLELSLLSPLLNSPGLQTQGMVLPTVSVFFYINYHN